MTEREAAELEAAEAARRICPSCSYGNLGDDPACHGCGVAWATLATKAAVGDLLESLAVRFGGEET